MPIQTFKIPDNIKDIDIKDILPMIQKIVVDKDIYWYRDKHKWLIEQYTNLKVSAGAVLVFNNYDEVDETIMYNLLYSPPSPHPLPPTIPSTTIQPQESYKTPLFYKENFLTLIEEEILVPIQVIEKTEELEFLIIENIYQTIYIPNYNPSLKLVKWTKEKPTPDKLYQTLTSGDKITFYSINSRPENPEGDFIVFHVERIDPKEPKSEIHISQRNLTDLIDKKALIPLEEVREIEEFRKIEDEKFINLSNSIAEKYTDPSILPNCDYILTTRDTIEFPFAIDYKNEWGIWEAIREIVQNSMDTETEIQIYTPDQNTIVIHDEGKGLSIKDFRLGGGEKAKLEASKKYIKDCDPSKLIRGAHGEGMKLTFLVLSKEPNKYKFYHYSRCIRSTSEFVMSPRFKEQTLNVYLDPIRPHRGTTFILSAPNSIIKIILNYCKTRFIYHSIYINGEQITHTQIDTSISIQDDKITKTKLIGHIVDLKLYDPITIQEKPFYIRGIYVKPIKTVFSYDFICPYLDSARNIVDISQIKEQIVRIYNYLEFNPTTIGTKNQIVQSTQSEQSTQTKNQIVQPTQHSKQSTQSEEPDKSTDQPYQLSKEIAEKFVTAIYLGKDIEFVEKGVYVRYGITPRAKEIYREVWNKVFGKNAFLVTNHTLTDLAEEQIYVERDENQNIIRELRYKPVIDLPEILIGIFQSSNVPKDTDIIVQKTINVHYSMKDVEKNEPHLIKNLRDAISVLCFLYKLNPDEELKKWDTFLVEYKTENQPPKNLWKKWDDIKVSTREEIFLEIKDLYEMFADYPLIVEKGLNLPLINFKDFHKIFEIKAFTFKKTEIKANYPDIANIIEKFENRIIPIKEKRGYYNHKNGRFGIRFDALTDRSQTFTVVLHEYAHQIKEVDDIDDYDSAMGKILRVIQTGYGKILDESLKYVDEIYEESILKIITDRPDMPDNLRINILKGLPDTISEIVFEICKEKSSKYMPKLPTPEIEEEVVEIEPIEEVETFE